MKTKTIKIYTCEHCNDEFDKESLVKTHELACLKRLEKVKRAENTKKKIVERFLTAASLPELKEQMEKFLGVSVNLRLEYGNVSNYHGCPINGVTNWGNQNKKAPTSYPGWLGHIEGEFCVDQLTDLRLFHSGTGGPGSKGQHGCNIGFYFFAQDFPKLEELVKQYTKTKESTEAYRREVSNNNSDAENFLYEAVRNDSVVQSLENQLQARRLAIRNENTPKAEEIRKTKLPDTSVELARLENLVKL